MHASPFHSTLGATANSNDRLPAASNPATLQVSACISRHYLLTH
jgi:hypothetical protein